MTLKTLSTMYSYLRLLTICDYLEFSRLVGYVHDFLPVTQQRNHQDAVLFLEAIDKYLQSEHSYGAVLGPFA